MNNRKHSSFQERTSSQRQTPYSRPNHPRTRQTPVREKKSLLSHVQSFIKWIKPGKRQQERDEHVEHESQDEQEDLDRSLPEQQNTEVFTWLSPVISNPFKTLEEPTDDRKKSHSESQANAAPSAVRLNKSLISLQNSLSNTQSLRMFGLEKSASKSRSKRNSEPLENGHLTDRLDSPSSQYTPLSTNSRKRRHTTQYSTFTPRKITHFSIVPSPYRPTSGTNVYQAITAASSPEPELENSVEVVKIEEKPKKISMTATAMLSLIDEPEDLEVEVVSVDSRPTKKFVNPYASTASKSTPRSNPPKLIRKTTTSPSSVIKSLERTMPLDNKTPNKETITKPILEKFKPVQSSSLRQSILSNNTVKTSLEPAKRHDTASTAIIEQSKAAPTWSVPEFFDDEMDIDEEVPNKKSEGSAEPFKFSPPTSTPAESKPFVFKGASAVPETKQPLLFGSAPKLDDKVAQKTPAPAVNGTKTFSFGSPASNESGSFNFQSKSSAPATFVTEKLSTSVPPAALSQPVANILHPKVEPVKESSINIPQFNLSTPAPLFGSKFNTIASTTSTSVDSVTAPSLFASKPAPVSVAAAVGSTKALLPLANGTLKTSDTEKIKSYSSLFELPTTSVAISSPVGSEKKIQELKALFKF